MSHTVRFSIPSRDLGKADVEFRVQRNGQKIGTLRVSRGSVVWLPRDSQSGPKLSWREFGKLMTESTERKERR